MVDVLLSNCILPEEIIIFLCATLPVVELRGAIPVGFLLDVSPRITFLMAILGSTLPAPFMIVFFRRAIIFMKKHHILPTLTRFFDYLMQRKEKKLKYADLFGLFLFVAIPLPSTGAYTGAMLASILNIRMRYALPAIFFGNIVAGLITVGFSHIVF